MILIIGGTRATGLHVAQQLRSRGAPVRILARDPRAAFQRLGPGFEIVRGDLTEPKTLATACEGVSDIVFTAGVRSGRFSRRSVTRATEYQGVLHTLGAAQSQGFSGRLVYMTSIGVRRASFFAWALNVWKGGTLHWRRLAEDAIRASGVDYTILRAAFLLNRAPHTRDVIVRQVETPLSFTEAIARTDVAEALVEAISHPAASRATLEIAWSRGPRTASWNSLFNELLSDNAIRA